MKFVTLLLCTACALGLPSKPEGEVLRPKLSYSRKVVSKPGSDETIDCGVEGIDLSGVKGFNIQWSKMESDNPIESYPISSGDQVVLFSTKYDVFHPEGTHQYSLKIKDIGDEDQGTYRCTVNFGGNQKITADVPVLVEKAPFFNTQMTRGLTVKEGDSISIDCQPGGSPQPTVYWQRVDHKLPFYAGNFAQTNQIEISDATTDSEGMYICHADNGVGSPVSSEVIINVMYKPRVNISSVVVFGELHQSVSVSCTSDAFNAATIAWKKDGEVLAESSHFTISEETVKRPEGEIFPAKDKFAVKPDFTKSMLTINSLSEDLAGVYTCEATNEVGDANATVEVKVKTPPMIENQSGRTVYYEDPIAYGRSAAAVRLECEASGVPTPHISWMKDGEPLFVEATDSISVDETGALVIDEPTTEDNGLYQCLAQNPSGVAKSDLMYLINSTRVSFERGPEAESLPNELTAEEGRPFKIECPKAEGDPKPKVAWLAIQPPGEDGKSQMEFVSSKRTVVGPDGTLFFTHVTMDDDNTASGVKYLCSAVSPITPQDYSIGHEVSLKVVKPADNIHNANNSDYNIAAVLMYATPDKTFRGAQDNAIHCIFGGEPAPSILWERADGQPMTDPELYEFDNFNSTVVLKNTNQQHQVVHRCHASNGVGPVETHEIDVKVVQPPIFKRDSLKSSVVKEGSDVTFNCEADATGSITYSWYFNGRPLSPTQTSRRRLTGSTLSISHVTLTDIGNYACNATSKDGYAYGQSTLNVEPSGAVEGGSDYAEVHRDLVEIKERLDAVQSQVQNGDYTLQLLERIAAKLNVTLPSKNVQDGGEQPQGVIDVMTKAQVKDKVETPAKVRGTMHTTA